MSKNDDITDDPAASAAGERQTAGEDDKLSQSLEKGASAEVDGAQSNISFDSERRIAYRLNKVLGAKLTSLEGEVQAARLFIIDISVTGFRATDHTPHTDEYYDIEVTLARDIAPFCSRMHVVWSKELTVSGMFQMGCEFIDTPSEEIVKLEAFIDQERRKVETKSSPTDLGRPWTMIR